MALGLLAIVKFKFHIRDIAHAVIECIECAKKLVKSFMEINDFILVSLLVSRIVQEMKIQNALMEIAHEKKRVVKLLSSYICIKKEWCKKKQIH